MNMNILKRAVILAVDDAPEILDIIKATLSGLYDIKLATRGQIALKIAEKQQPDLILLDVVMPDFDGYETCRALKANPATAHIPVIMISAGSKVNDELVGLEAGAIDYITKPISTVILKARVKSQIELGATRNALAEAHNKISQERENLEQIVFKMRNNSDFNQQYVRYATQSPEINSGDLVLSAISPEGVQSVIVADFTGHGLPAAIGGPLVTYVFYRRIWENVSLCHIIGEINTLLEKILPINIFMGLLAVEVSANRKQAKLWNYGMEDILLYDTDKNWQSYASQNVALGILSEIDCAVHYDLSLSEQQLIYLLTDGMTEAVSSEDASKMFGMPQLKEALINNVQQGKPLGSILEDIMLFAGNPEDFDDMTLLELRVSTNGK